jgi:hypothetical protein
MRHFTLLIISFFLLFACSKAKRSGWVVADIEVVDGYTGEPIPMNVYIGYWAGAGPSQAYEEMEEIGETDEFGRMHIEHKVGWKESGFKIKIPQTFFYGGIAGDLWYREFPVSTVGKNQMVIELWPKHPISLNVTNINCSGPTDTLWLSTSSGYSNTIVGCADLTIMNSYGFTLMVDEPQITFDITTKKSGVINTYSQSFTDLVPADYSYLQIDY